MYASRCLNPLRRRLCAVARRGASMATTNQHIRPYQLSPLPVFGVEAHGIDLKQPIAPEVMDAIKEDVTKHRIVVFRDQGVVSGRRQVELSREFGELESTFYKHPRSPDPDVFRVSNDPEEGCTGVGRTGWHVDGSFQPAPFAYSIYHIVSVPREGDTRFVALTELIASLPAEQRARWERLSILSDRRGGSVKPLIYSHPRTGLDTLCFHLGMTAAFVVDAGRPAQRITSPRETAEILAEMERVLQRSDGLIYYHKWREGDFIISDNAALGHEASEGTQTSKEQAGLRVMHRTTIKGTKPPTKAYRIDEQGCRLAGG